MNEILKQVAIARRRLMAITFLQALAHAWLITFAIAVVMLIIPKLWPLPFDLSRWPILCIATAAGLGIIWAIAVAIVRRPSTVSAATEIDLRLKLRERLSSTMQLGDEQRQSAIGQALMQDAQREASRIDLRDAFPVRLDRQYLWGLIPIVLAAATFLIPNAVAPEAIVKGLDTAALTQVKSTTKDLMELVRKQREKAEEEGIDEAVDFFKQLQNKVEEIQKSNTTDAKKILSDINQLKEAMQKRRDELGSSESLKKNLEGLKSLDKGPAEKLTEAMKDGEFEEASEELQKMMDDLESGKLSKEQASQLSKQMEQMAAAIEKAIAEHELEKKSLEKKIAEAQNAGDIEKVAELRKKLAEKQAQDGQLEELAAMAQQMSEAKESLDQGDQAGAKKAMEKMKASVEKMGADAKQLRELDEMMEGANACKNCINGQGAGKGGKEPQWKQGKGEGPGGGPRPEEETETKHIESQVQTDMKKGETVYGGKAGGANRKGVSREEIKQAILTAEAEEAEALDNIPLTKKQRDQSREYFESLRDNK
jgi:hypothetical protein